MQRRHAGRRSPPRAGTLAPALGKLAEKAVAPLIVPNDGLAKAVEAIHVVEVAYDLAEGQWTPAVHEFALTEITNQLNDKTAGISQADINKIERLLEQQRTLETPAAIRPAKLTKPEPETKLEAARVANPESEEIALAQPPEPTPEELLDAVQEDVTPLSESEEITSEQPPELTPELEPELIDDEPCHSWEL